MSAKTWKRIRDVALLIVAIITPLAVATDLLGPVGPYVPVLLAIATMVVWQAERRLPEDRKILGPKVPVIYLNNTDVSGTIPDLSACTSLRYLRLYNADISGYTRSTISTN